MERCEHSDFLRNKAPIVFLNSIKKKNHLFMFRFRVMCLIATPSLTEIAALIRSTSALIARQSLPRLAKSPAAPRKQQAPRRDWCRPDGLRRGLSRGAAASCPQSIDHRLTHWMQKEAAGFNFFFFVPRLLSCL